MKRSLAIACVIAALLIIASAAWSGPQGEKAPTQSATPAWKEWKYKKAGPVLEQTPDSFYSYDDLSKKVNIRMVSYGWVPDQPFPADDPIRAYVEKKFNCTMSFDSLSGEVFLSKVMAQIASGTAPDVLAIGDQATALKLLEQGALAGDHSKYLQYVPAITQQYYETDLLQAMSGDVLYAVPKHNASAEYYWIQIRQDWLDKLGLKQPTTDTELMRVADAFTFKDPDGNGKDDTYGFMTWGLKYIDQHWAGLNVFQAMYGNPGWSVENGKLTNPILNGTRLKFLKFFRTAIEKGVMDPDYMGSSPGIWHPKKLVGGTVGIFSYHTDITNEAENMLGKPGELLGTWRMLDQPLRGDDGKSGGKRRPNTDNVSVWFAFTKQGVQDDAKVKRILHLLDWWQFPNGLGQMFGGYQIFPNITEVRTKDYVYYGGRGATDPRDSNPAYTALQNWSYPGMWYTGMIWGSSPEPTATQKFIVEQQKLVASLPRYPNNLLYICRFPPELTTTMNDFTVQSETDFLTGKRSLDTWDSYVTEWKKKGGQEMYDLMVKQLTQFGLLK